MTRCKDCKHANKIDGRTMYLHCTKFDMPVRRFGECTLAFVRLMNAVFKKGGCDGKD